MLTALRCAWKRFPVAMALAPVFAILYSWWGWLEHDVIDTPGWPGWQLHGAGCVLIALCYSVAVSLLVERKAGRNTWLWQAAGGIVGAGFYLLSMVFYVDTFFPPTLQLLLSALLLICFALIQGESFVRLRQFTGLLAVCTAAGFFLCALLWYFGRAMLYIFNTVGEYSGLYSTQYYFAWSGINHTAAAVSFGWAGIWVLLSMFSEMNEHFAEKADRITAKGLTFLIPLFCLWTAIETVAYVYLLVSGHFRRDGWLNPYVLMLFALYAALQLLLDRDENRLSRFYVKYSAWLILPLYLLQLIGAYLRVNAYSLTDNRLLSIVFLAACLIPLEAGLRARRGYLMLPLLTVLLILLTATPLNAIDMSGYAQENRIFGLLSQAGMLDEGGRIVACQQDLSSDQQDEIIKGVHYLNGWSRAPSGSRTAVLQARIRETDGISDSERIDQLLGFRQSDSSRDLLWLSTRLSGHWRLEKLETIGYSSAEMIAVGFNAQNEYTVVFENTEITMDMILPYTDFEHSTLVTDEILLSDQAALRIYSLTKSERKDEVEYWLEGWLMKK